jgi:hypothetical protein
MNEEIDFITGLPVQSTIMGRPVADEDPTKAWVEKYRGITLDESDVRAIILPDKMRNWVIGMLQLGGYNNYIFYSGVPGTGKTSLAEALPLLMGAEREVLYAQRDSEIIDAISEGGMYRSGNGLPKYFVIDEADNPSNPDSFYRKLQSLIEATSSNLRFILTCNDIGRLPAAIRSRCKEIPFDHPGDDKGYKNRIYKHLKKIAKKETAITGGQVSKETLVETINACYPDVRAMVNAMHLTFLEHGGSIVGHPNVIREESIAKLYRNVIAMDPRRLRYFISQEFHDCKSVYVPFGLYFFSRIPLPVSGQVDWMYIQFGSMLGKAYRASNTQVNQEIALYEFLCDVMMLIGQYQMIGKMGLDPVELQYEKNNTLTVDDIVEEPEPASQANPAPAQQQPVQYQANAAQFAQAAPTVNAQATPVANAQYAQTAYTGGYPNGRV